jgi:ornithine cyclodeaminase/alanine dehydrogenase-like protein (mu-crystallin family)
MNTQTPGGPTPDDALLITEVDLKPLATVASHIDAAIDAVEQATLAMHRGGIGQATFLGHPRTDGRPSARLTLATGAGMATGVRVFGSPAPDYLRLARPNNTRAYVLLHGETGQVLALLSWSRLNPLRVGAVGGLAARYLAPVGARVLAILGSGQQARTQVQAVCRAVPSIEQVLVYSPTPAHREAFAREMSTWLGVRAEAVGSIGEATQAADVVDLANASTEPIVKRSQIKAGALVISVTEGQLPTEFVDTTRAVFVTWEAAAADLPGREPYSGRIKAGTFTKADLAAELPGVVAGEATPRRMAEDVVVFDLTASAVHDLAIAQWAYSWARANGVGTPFVLSTE